MLKPFINKDKGNTWKCGKLFIHFMRSCDFGDLANISKAKGKNGPVKLYGETNTPKWSNNMQIFRAFDIINCQKTRFCRVNLVNWKETKLPEFQENSKAKVFVWLGFDMGTAFTFDHHTIRSVMFWIVLLMLCFSRNVDILSKR